MTFPKVLSRLSIPEDVSHHNSECLGESKCLNEEFLRFPSGSETNLTQPMDSKAPWNLDNSQQEKHPSKVDLQGISNYPPTVKNSDSVSGSTLGSSFIDPQRITENASALLPNLTESDHFSPAQATFLVDLNTTSEQKYQASSESKNLKEYPNNFQMAFKKEQSHPSWGISEQYTNPPELSYYNSGSSATSSIPTSEGGGSQYSDSVIEVTPSDNIYQKSTFLDTSNRDTSSTKSSSTQDSEPKLSKSPKETENKNTFDKSSNPSGSTSESTTSKSEQQQQQNNSASSSTTVKNSEPRETRSRSEKSSGPVNEAERRNRVLLSKRRWAQKRRREKKLELEAQRAESLRLKNESLMEVRHQQPPLIDTSSHFLQSYNGLLSLSEEVNLPPHAQHKPFSDEALFGVLRSPSTPNQQHYSPESLHSEESLNPMQSYPAQMMNLGHSTWRHMSHPVPHLYDTSQHHQTDAGHHNSGYPGLYQNQDWARWGLNQSNVSLTQGNFSNPSQISSPYYNTLFSSNETLPSHNTPYSQVGGVYMQNQKLSPHDNINPQHLTMNMNYMNNMNSALKLTPTSASDQTQGTLSCPSSNDSHYTSQNCPKSMIQRPMMKHMQPVPAHPGPQNAQSLARKIIPKSSSMSNMPPNFSPASDAILSIFPCNQMLPPNTTLTGSSSTTPGIGLPESSNAEYPVFTQSFDSGVTRRVPSNNMGHDLLHYNAPTTDFNLPPAGDGTGGNPPSLG